MSRELSYVYCIKAEHSDLIKIGRAHSPHHRLIEMQVGCPTKLSIVAVMAEHDGPMGHEEDWHNLFAADRGRGEWFRPSENLMAAVNHYMSMAGDRRPEPRAVPLAGLPNTDILIKMFAVARPRAQISAQDLATWEWRANHAIQHLADEARKHLEGGWHE